MANGGSKLSNAKVRPTSSRPTTKVEIGEGTHVADSASITVQEAGELWLESGRRANLEVSTLDQYAQHVRLHLVPLIGREKLSKLTVPFLRAFQDRLHNEGRSAPMIKGVIRSLGGVLADAQERGLIVGMRSVNLTVVAAGDRDDTKAKN